MIAKVFVKNLNTLSKIFDGNLCLMSGGQIIPLICWTCRSQFGSIVLILAFTWEAGRRCRLKSWSLYLMTPPTLFFCCKVAIAFFLPELLLRSDDRLHNFELLCSAFWLNRMLTLGEMAAALKPSWMFCCISPLEYFFPMKTQLAISETSAAI